MICRKCKSTGTITIRKEYIFCDTCFLSYIDHKFRACLGKNKKISANEQVLVCLSGGAGSTALLNLVHNGISIRSHKKLRIIPYFLHISGENTFSNDKEIDELLSLCKKLNFHLYVVDINCYFSPNNILTNLDSSLSHFDNDWKVSSTTKDDLISQMKHNLFVRVAKELGCKYVFTGESTTTLAVSLLSNITIGRGSQIENNIGFCDKKSEAVQILRPIRDITLEEIENYIRIKNILPPKKRERNNNLQTIVEDFVLGLQDTAPATLNTICKTADKMSSTSISKDLIKCRFCKNNLNNVSNKLTAAQATNFSRLVSSTKPDIDGLSFPSEIVLDDENLCYTCCKHVTELRTLGAISKPLKMY